MESAKDLNNFWTYKIEYTNKAEKIAAIIIKSSPPDLLGFCTYRAMKEYNIDPIAFKKCEYCGLSYCYSKKWMEEHKIEVAYEILKIKEIKLKNKHSFFNFFKRNRREI